MVRPDVTPDAPLDEQPCIGLIGMGAMGNLYARCFSEAGWKKIYICDLPSKYDDLKEKYKDIPGVHVLKDGHLVSRISDYIVYSVEAEFIDRVVAEFGPSTKIGAIVAGQTSVKAPEKAAFEKYLPSDVHILSCHSLHGPTVSTVGQPLVLIQHRATEEALTLVKHILAPLRSRYVYLSYEDHDIVTANTQAVTHAAFLTMGTAWHCSASYPWEHGMYVGGIETVKVNIMLRIYSNKWHVYAGLAILNPSARVQIDQFARSTTEIFKLMLAGDAAGLRSRIYAARKKVFGECLPLSPRDAPAPPVHPTALASASTNGNTNANGSANGNGKPRAPILLSEDVLDRFSLGKKPAENTSPTSRAAPANSHLSLLAMVDCWAHLGINPFVHLDLAATPIFRLWIGVAEYLFRSEARLDAALHAALYDTTHRSDDLEFVVGARGWSQCISFGSFELYKQRFMHTSSFFESRFEEAAKVGSAMIQALMDTEESVKTK